MARDPYQELGVSRTATTDEVRKAFIPAFADAQVWAGGNQNKPITRPAVEPVRIWHLLTHTSGLTYGFLHAHPTDAMHRAAGVEFFNPDVAARQIQSVNPGITLEQANSAAWRQGKR